jgi:hypothetical protein
MCSLVPCYPHIVFFQEIYRKALRLMKTIQKRNIIAAVSKLGVLKALS